MMLPIVELNIGHFIVGEAIFVGIEAAIVGMRMRMDRARALAESAVS
jgi:pyridoxine 5-phosphate synthase